MTEEINIQIFIIMLKNILNLDGVVVLSKTQQRTLSGD
jgi:hypothetical protein